nr:hypothetical protein [uncultured Cohaesibacter sp.]
MAEKTTSDDHVFLRDRMRGHRGWIKTVVYALSGLVMLTMFASNLLQSF